MDKERYNVCFKGEVLPGFDPDKSKNDFVRMFKIPAEKANIVFSGKPIVLKKTLINPQQ